MQPAAIGRGVEASHGAGLAPLATLHRDEVLNAVAVALLDEEELAVVGELLVHRVLAHQGVEVRLAAQNFKCASARSDQR